MALRELIAEFGIHVDDKELERAGHNIEHLIGTMKKFAGAAIAGAFVAEAVSMFNEVSHVADGLDKMSAKIGVSTAALQEWQYAAKLAGVDAGTLQQAFGIVQRNAYQAANGSEEMQKAFRKIGVSVKGSNGELKDSDTLLTEVGEGLSGLKNDSERTALSMLVLGKSGKELLPLFKDGAKGVNALRAEFRELGLGLDEDTIKGMVEYRDNTERLEASMFALKSMIAMYMLPAMGWMVEKVRGAVNWFRSVTKDTHAVKIAFAMLGVAAGVLAVKMLIAFAGPLFAVLAIAAGVTAFILIVDDLITMFEGGDSVIGEFIDTIFGLGAAKTVVEALTETFRGTYEMVKNIVDMVKFIIPGLDSDLGKDISYVAEKLGIISGDKKSKPLGKINSSSVDGQIDVDPLGGTMRAFGLGGGGSQTVKAPGAAAGGGVVNNVTNNQTNHIPIKANVDAAAVGHHVKRVAREMHHEQLQQTRAALVPVGG